MSQTFDTARRRGKLLEKAHEYVKLLMGIFEALTLDEAPQGIRKLVLDIEAELSSGTVTCPPPLNVRPLVWKFARRMEDRLAANDHKDGHFASGLEILARIQDELAELTRSMGSSAGAAHPDECADIANFCAMLAAYDRPLWPQVNEKEEGGTAEGLEMAHATDAHLAGREPEEPVCGTCGGDRVVRGDKCEPQPKPCPKCAGEEDDPLYSGDGEPYGGYYQREPEDG